jgi:SAM-dependent methyltransferase
METPARIDLGCGDYKREGFFGIDIVPGASVDLVLDMERSPLPFPDQSVDHIYSSHTFEHFTGWPVPLLREIMRVAKHNALVEVWTPHGRSDTAYLWGHHAFYTETTWRHVCFDHDDFYFGKDIPGRFDWQKTQYSLYPNILEKLSSSNVPIELALEHMANIAWEFGVFLRVDKAATKARNPQNPVRELCMGRYNPVRII